MKTLEISEKEVQLLEIAVKDRMKQVLKGLQKKMLPLTLMTNLPVENLINDMQIEGCKGLTLLVDDTKQKIQDTKEYIDLLVKISDKKASSNVDALYKAVDGLKDELKKFEPYYNFALARIKDAGPKEDNSSNGPTEK